MKQKLLGIYDKHYKKFTLFSFLILLACIGVLVNQYVQTGEWFEKSVSLKGGITLTAPANGIDIHTLDAQLDARFPNADIDVREITEGGQQSAIIVEAADVTSDELTAALKDNGISLKEGKYSLESMGSSLGESFFGQIIRALLIAFVAMSLVVFITFRTAFRSVFIIIAVLSDLLSTLAVVNLLGVKLSTAGIAAFLMLIGYAVDTDILLTTHVIKRKSEGGTVFSRTINAMKTGVPMTLTALAASIVGLIFTKSDIIFQIMLIVTIGMVFDLIYTWFQNAGILRMYMEKYDKP